MLKQGFQIDTRTSAIALGGFWCLTTPILKQKQRQGCRKNSVLVPARMGFQVALKGFVQVFRDFCQDANGCVHIYLTLVPCVLGQCKPYFQRRRGTGFPTESLRQMNLEKHPLLPPRSLFSIQNFYGLVAPLSAEMGWGCQCCEILQPLANPQNLHERIRIRT